MVLLLIYLEQLDVLGFTHEYRTMTLMLMGLFIMYFFIKKLVVWLFKKERTMFLTYLISSLLLLVIVLFRATTVEKLPFIQKGVRVAIVFGLILTIISLLQLLRFIFERRGQHN